VEYSTQAVPGDVLYPRRQVFHAEEKEAKAPEQGKYGGLEKLETQGSLLICNEFIKFKE
jgi:hypothetical protein